MRSSCATLFLLAALAPLALAEPVTHQFTGQVSSFGGALDVSSLFPLGTAVAVDVTVERSTIGVPQDASMTEYTNALTMVAFTVGSWTGGSAPANSTVRVTNNAPSPGQPGVNYDQYYWNALGVSAPSLGSVMLNVVTSTLDDIEGTVWDSQAIPRVFPALGAFDGKTVTFQFIDFSSFKSGYFMATLANVSTPAKDASWGGIKALYRQ